VPNLFSVSMNLAVSDLLCKWNCTLRDLLCLASFRDVFKVRPCSSVDEDFIFFRLDHLLL
jgi:hypothetical protein